MNTEANLNEMTIAFPGQLVEAKAPQGEAQYISVPKTEDNEHLLKFRGYFYERGATELRVYFPSESMFD